MLSPKTLGWLCLLALFGLFGYAASRVILLRVDHGDIYPKYSSFRADPFGSKALLESLSAMDNVQAGRNLKRFSDLSEAQDTTLFVLGLAPESLSDSQLTYAEAFDQFLTQGNRLVLAFDGYVDGPRTEFFKQLEAEKRAVEEEQETEPEPESIPPDQDHATELPEENQDTASLQPGEVAEPLREELRMEEWPGSESAPATDPGSESAQQAQADLPTSDNPRTDESRAELEEFEALGETNAPVPPLVDVQPLDTEPPQPAEPEAEAEPEKEGFTLPEGSEVTFGFDWIRAEDETPLSLPVRRIGTTQPDIDWPGLFYFASHGAAWTVEYAASGQPVVLERRVGEGSLVLVADAYHFSNEALWRHPQAGLLSWLCGPNRQVLFEESHFGMNFKPSLGMLIWRYRLHGVMVGLLFLAALFLWKNAQPLVPPGERSWHAETVGKDAAAGLNHLLRRSIAKKGLLRTCWEQWRAVGSLGGRARPNIVEEAENLLVQQDQLPARDRELISGYSKLREIIAKRR